MAAKFGLNPQDLASKIAALTGYGGSIRWDASRPDGQPRRMLDTSRAGYLAALSASSYSFVSMVRRFAPLTGPGSSFISLSYLASERVIHRSDFKMKLSLQSFKAISLTMIAYRRPA